MAETWTQDDLKNLASAKRALEAPSLTERITTLVGRPVDIGLKLLPKGWNRSVLDLTQFALMKGLEFSVRTIGSRGGRRSRDLFHKALSFGSGTVGGALGGLAIGVELPLSTCIMLRSIADIARSEGHCVRTLDTKLACLEVFALGGKGKGDDSMKEGYWLVRSALAKEISDAAAYIAKNGLSHKGSPAIVRLIAAIASRFSVVVTEEAAAKLVPAIGAISGGVVNLVFISHFQDLARGHFVIKRLEKTYGPESVREAYEAIRI